MAKKGTLIALVGLIVGLCAGFGVVTLKRYIGQQLMGLLGDELKDSCPCSLAYDSVQISLLSLRAVGKNVRIVEGGVEKLAFPRIEADFSLKKIRERKVLLTELRLMSGHAEGVGPESATFRFVDRLAAPIPPERDRPGRWKIKLQRLVLTNSTFNESLGTYSARGESVALTVARDETNNFDLIASAGNLRINRPQGGPIILGSLATDMYLHDDYVWIKNVSLKQPHAAFQGELRTDLKNNEAFSGNYGFSINPAQARLFTPLVGTIHGEGLFSGDISSPFVSGNFKNNPDSELTFSLSPDTAIPIESLLGEFQLSSGSAGTILGLNKIDLSAHGIRIKNLTALSSTNAQLSGVVSISGDHVQLGSTVLKGLASTLTLDGTLNDPSASLRGNLGEILAGSKSLGLLSVSADYKSDQLSLHTRLAQDGGEITLRGDIGVDTSGHGDPLSINKMTLEAKDLPLSSNFSLSGRGDFSGPVSLDGVNGSLAFTIHSPSLPLAQRFEGGVQIKDGKLASTISDSERTMQATASLSLADPYQGNVILKAKNFEYLRALRSSTRPDEMCGSFSASLDYQFVATQFDHGSGSLALDDLSIGCGLDSLNLLTPAHFSITDGTLAVAPISLRVRNTEVSLSGEVSSHAGFRLSAVGDTRLQSLTALFPMFDELDGKLGLQMTLSGPFAHPKIGGTASLRDGVAEVAASDLSIRNIEGNLSLEGDKINFDTLSGTLNDGPFEIHGYINPFEIKNSVLELKSERAILTPSASFTTEISSNLKLTNLDQNRPVLSGAISIDYAEFERNISITDILRDITRSIFNRGQSESRSGPAQLPSIELDIHIIAPNNLFVVTNWAEAELKADIVIQGELSDPKVRGAIEARSGWFGLRERKFEITNGSVKFQGGGEEPLLDILGEANVRTREGETAVIFAQVSGPLSRAKLSLSSDRGLSEAEIIPLITSTGSLTAEARVGTISQSVEIDFLPFLNDNSAFGAIQLLKYLSRIDSISLEPTYNPQRGSVDPTITAQKKLLDKLYLIGESSFGPVSTDSRVRLLYELFPYLKLVSYANAASATTASAVGVDVAYEVLSDKVVTLNTVIQGNGSLSDESILKAARINSSSRVLESDLPKIKERSENLYRSQGYYSAAVTAQCGQMKASLDRYCNELSLTITEGRQSVITGYEIQGDAFPSAVNVSMVLPDPGDQTATDETLKSLLFILTARLRNEGYIGARLSGKYDVASNGDATLVLNLSLGSPYTFIFLGNTVYTPEDFLNSISLFERKQPFGSNTINILLENMKHLYAEKGYSFARLLAVKSVDEDSGRVTYTVRIDEGGAYKVTAVSIDGNDSLSTDTIKEKIKSQSLLDYNTIFKPKVAVSEDLDYAAHVLQSFYVGEGFPDATVIHRVASDPVTRTIQIIYTIAEGKSFKADWISVAGIPPFLETPAAPDAPYSIDEANKYIDKITELLRAEGYFSVAVSSLLDPISSQLTIMFEPGPRTFVGEILVEGNKSVDTSTILKELAIKSGSPWRTPDLIKSRNNLLRLGLFSRVELSPVREIVDQASETLVARVTERDLRSMDVGTGYNSAYGLHLFGQFTDRKLFADGRTMRYRIDSFFDRADDEISQGVASITYSSPSFLRSDYGFISDMRFQRLDLSTQEFDLDRLSLSSALYRSLENGITLTSSYTYFLENLENVPADVILSDLDNGTVNLGFLSGTLTYDRRDDALNPLSGYQLGLDALLADSALGSEGNYAGVGSKASVTYPILLGEQQFALAVLGRAASAWTFGGTDYVPISQRYYLGGINTVRGFKENSLGPRGAENNVIGGDLSVMQNAEFQYFFSSSAEAHVFFDAGTVFLKQQDPSWGDMRTSTGIGARYLSPIGPIGLDIGFPTDREDGESRYQIHFHIGSRF